ncbi:8403_t:CDS:2 [Funneliformis geosporum]|uniref:8403_t:CDS:1 n=1 Tax=Funneliformis geosporum TaxID=1117311 RepID=A0A9W4SYF3_9GLOM|nr:8403_t:CDS:2 [Funneliformis geosporum]
MSSTTNLAVSSIARRSKPPICEKCDNCIKRIANKPKLFDGKEKIMKLLEAIEFLTQKEQQISPDDIVDIFRGGKTVKIKQKNWDTLHLSEGSIGLSSSIIVIGIIFDVQVNVNMQI